MQQHDQLIQELSEIKRLLQLSQPVLTLKQFCLMADISEAYAYQLTRTGRIKFSRPFGKKIYIDRDDAIEVLKQNPVKTRRMLKTQVENHFLTSKKVSYGND